MATSRILAPAMAWGPITTNTYGGRTVVPALLTKSIATAAAVLLPEKWVHQFEDGADLVGVFMNFRMPGDYASGLELKFDWFSLTNDGGSETVSWNGYIAAVSNGEGFGAKTFDSLNETVSDVPATAQTLDQDVIAFTNEDSVAADDSVILFVVRDPADAGDTHEHAIYWDGGILEYTTT